MKKNNLLILGIVLVGVIGATFAFKEHVSIAHNKSESTSGDLKKSTNSSFQKIEQEFDATLGVYGINTENNQVVAYKENERFAYASTHKALIGGIILRDFSWEELSKNIMITENDLVSYSPITEKYVGVGMPLRELISAAIQYSDNTAGNFLFKQLGGPKNFQSKLESLGDSVTNSSRIEPDLNEAVPGDIRDTSTPKAFAQNFEKLTLGSELPDDKLAFFKKQLIGNATGDNLIRAGVPTDVIVGDKSGAASYGTRNDIAVLYPPHKKPIILVVFSKKEQQDSQYKDELISKTAKVVSDYFDLS